MVLWARLDGACCHPSRPQGPPTVVLDPSSSPSQLGGRALVLVILVVKRARAHCCQEEGQGEGLRPRRREGE